MSSLLPVMGTAAPVESLRVLLVEDDDGDAFLVQELLDEAVSQVESCAPCTLAEAEAEVSRVDCVLLDLGLPDASGLDGLRRLAAHADGVALLVLTGLSDERRGAEAVAAGAQDYLVKGQVDGQLLTLRDPVRDRPVPDRGHRASAARAAAARRGEHPAGARPAAQPPDRRQAGLSAARYQAGGRRLLLGGDFYDAVRDSDGTLHVLIGDVSGHGPDEAALGEPLAAHRLARARARLASVRRDPRDAAASAGARAAPRAHLRDHVHAVDLP